MRYKKLLPIAIMVLITSTCLGATVALSETADAVHLRWAFVSFSPSETGGELMAIQKDAPMQSGDHFKFFLERKTACYIYLVYLSTQNKITLLYPSSTKAYDTLPATDAPQYLPQGEDWFQLDDQSGKERFYLLASASRLTSLEDLLSHYAAANNDAEESTRNKAVLAEIRKLRLKNRKFQRTAERPTSIMGQVRGMSRTKKPKPQEVSDLAKEIRADQFFSKAYTIDHR